MPVGQPLINAVASVLTDEPSKAYVIQSRLVGAYSSRAIRYALKILVEQGRARRAGRIGCYVAAIPVLKEGV